MDTPRLLGLAMFIWMIPAQIVQINIAISATGVSGHVERLQHAAQTTQTRAYVHERHCSAPHLSARPIPLM
jgi:hypothetical protein